MWPVSCSGKACPKKEDQKMYYVVEAKRQNEGIVQGRFFRVKGNEVHSNDQKGVARMGNAQE